MLEEPDKFNITYTPDASSFVRQDENIETRYRITVSGEHTEIRQITLKNTGNIEEILEISSLFEPVLSKKEQDYAHPSFNNLFLKYEQDGDAIIVKRNRRGNEKELYLVTNFYSNLQNTMGELEFEIDKEKLYEGGSTSIPKMIKESIPFSRKIGLFPNSVISMRKTVKINPGEKVTLNLVIGVSEKLTQAKENVMNYENMENVERAFEVSKAKIEEEIRFLNLNGKSINTFQKMLSYLVFPNDIKRIFSQNKQSYKKEFLWKYGISGDLPILIVEISEPNDYHVVKELLKAFEYFNVKNIQIDLLILMKEENIYEQYIKQNVYKVIEDNNLTYLLNTKGGIYLLNENEITDIEGFKAFANFIVNAKEGNLDVILADKEEEYLESLKENVLMKNENIPLPEFNDIDVNIKMEDLKYYNGYGGFSENGKEYIMCVNKYNKTPTVWSNVLSNEKFGCIVTNNLGGYTWSKNSRLGRLTAWSNDAVLDIPSEIVYIKDKNLNLAWSLGLNVMPDDKNYYITFGFGYTKVNHCSYGLIQNEEIFVPRNESVKITKIILKNTMPIKRNLKLIYYMKPVLGEDEINSLYHIDTEFLESQNIVIAKNLNQNDISKIMYISSSEKINSYTGRKNEVGNIYNPSILNMMCLSNENAYGSQSRIAIQIDVELASYEDKEIVLMFGEAENLINLQDICYKYSKIENVNTELENVKDFWNNLLGNLQVNTPVESMNIMLNGWAAYQTIACRLWAKSGFYQSGGAYGFRDQLQDTLGIKFLSDFLMEKQIKLHAKHQFLEGDVEHWWHEETKRGIRTRFSDDLLWLAYITVEYVEYTNNYEILDEEISFIQGEELKVGEDERYEFYPETDQKQSLYIHIIKAIERTLNFGENGLPKIGSGDWNDGFSTVGNKGKGESVWLGFFLYEVLERIIPICKKREDIELAEKYEKIKIELKKKLNNIGWDGRWYKRAICDDGNILGSIENEECKIDSISQSWSVISNAGDNDKKYIAMESLENHLVDKANGIIKLLDPPFEKSKIEPGYIKSYLPGVRENGGQYTHVCCC